MLAIVSMERPAPVPAWTVLLARQQGSTACSTRTRAAIDRSVPGNLSSIITSTSEACPDLQVGTHLAHVGVTDDDVQPPVLVRVGTLTGMEPRRRIRTSEIEVLRS